MIKKLRKKTEKCLRWIILKIMRFQMKAYPCKLRLKLFHLLKKVLTHWYLSNVSDASFSFEIHPFSKLQYIIINSPIFKHSTIKLPSLPYSDRINLLNVKNACASNTRNPTVLPQQSSCGLVFAYTSVFSFSCAVIFMVNLDFF